MTHAADGRFVTANLLAAVAPGYALALIARVLPRSPLLHSRGRVCRRKPACGREYRGRALATVIA